MRGWEFLSFWVARVEDVRTFGVIFRINAFWAFTSSGIRVLGFYGTGSVRAEPF